MSWVTKFLADENGGTAIDYAMVLGLISLASIVTWTAMGDTLTNNFGVISNELDDAG